MKCLQTWIIRDNTQAVKMPQSARRRSGNTNIARRDVRDDQLQTLPPHQRNVTENIRVLAGYMDLDEVKSILFEKGVLPPDMVQDVDSLPVGNVNKSIRLLMGIARLNQEKFNIVVGILRENNQAHMADMLLAPPGLEEPDHWTIMRTNLRAIRENLDPDDILGVLYSEGIISMVELEHIQSVKAKTQKAGLLIEVMRRKTPSDYEKFKTLLTESGQEHIIELLTTAK